MFKVNKYSPNQAVISKAFADNSELLGKLGFQQLCILKKM